jgi:hypothetical protein
MRKIFETVKQWVGMLILAAPAWVYGLLPAAVQGWVGLAWDSLDGGIKGLVVAVVLATIVSGIGAFLYKKKADGLRPWSGDGKNNTPDIRARTGVDGKIFLEVLGRMIKPSFWLLPISYIFNPFFRMVTKIYPDTGEVSTPTPKTISSIRKSDGDCDFPLVDMRIRGRATKRFIEVRKCAGDNKDLSAAMKCVVRHVTFDV